MLTYGIVAVGTNLGQISMVDLSESSVRRLTHDCELPFS